MVNVVLSYRTFGICCVETAIEYRYAISAQQILYN